VPAPASAAQAPVSWAPWAEDMALGRRPLRAPTARQAAPATPGSALTAAIAAPRPLQNISPGNANVKGSHKWEWWGEAMKRAELAGFDPLQSLPENAPKSVWACVLGAWSFLMTDGATGEVCSTPFKCKSWRCPSCRYKVARADYARILEALQKRNVSADCLVLTLTFDPSKWSSQAEVYRQAGRCWQKLLNRLRRKYGSHAAPAPIGYLAVWERHQSGWAHVHLVVHSKLLADDVRRRGQCDPKVHPYRAWRWDQRIRKQVPNWAWKPEVLEDLAVATGFGKVSDVQFPRAAEGGLAGYFLKLTGELVGCFDQRPINAPKGFRRLRASRRFLPARKKGSGRIGGRVVQAPIARVQAHPFDYNPPVPAIYSRWRADDQGEEWERWRARHLSRFRRDAAERFQSVMKRLAPCLGGPAPPGSPA
jgi:hypothetical protein